MRRASLLSMAFFLMASVYSRANLLAADGTTLHFAFAGTGTADRPVVHLPGIYTAEAGFGFADTADITANAKGMQGERFFRFDVALPDGSYDVTATVGSPQVNSVTTIRSQDHRQMVADISTKANEFREITFTVNVHRDVAVRNGPASNNRMHLEFIGQNPSLAKLDIRPNAAAPVVYLAGDSTMCDYSEDPRFGWGQMFPVFFKPGEVAICNCARSGRTAKSFMGEKRLDDILRIIKPGDFMLIQFGHNDMKDPTLTPEKWKAQLMAFIDGARARKAFAALVTSMPRRKFGDDGKIVNTLLNYPEMMRELAKEQKIPLIDLNIRAAEFFNTLGPEGTKKAFCYYPLGMYAGFPKGNAEKGNADDTHFNPYGAYELAKIVARGIKDAHFELSSHVVDVLDPENTDPEKFSPNFAYNSLLVKK